jgi:hypothetical protein
MTIRVSQRYGYQKSLIEREQTLSFIVGGRTDNKPVISSNSYISVIIVV